MDLKVFKNGIGALLQAFPDRDINSKIYWTFLQDLSNEGFSSAISKIVTSEKDIYPGTNMIALIRDKALNTNKITGGEAWAEVLRQISSIGSWGQPKFKDELISKAVAGVGWKDMCMSENIMVERAHFLKIYDSLEKRDKEEKTMIGSDSKQIKGLIGDLSEKLSYDRD